MSTRRTFLKELALTAGWLAAPKITPQPAELQASVDLATAELTGIGDSLTWATTARGMVIHNTTGHILLLAKTYLGQEQITVPPHTIYDTNSET